jgi:hypothetical protein
VSGTIPSEVGSCSMLKQFKVPSCKLSGTLPKEIGGLIHMQLLDISFNRGLVGTLPLEFDGLDSLVEMNFDETKISGSVSNSLCKNLNTAIIINLSVKFCDCCKRGQ